MNPNECSQTKSDKGGQTINDIEALVIAIIREAKKGRPVERETRLEADLGFDSIETVNLVIELEQKFGIQLLVTISGLHELATPADIVDAVIRELKWNRT